MIVVPASVDGLHPSVIPALMRAGAPEVRVLPMRQEDSYFRALDYLWGRCGSEREDLTIVEHDIEVLPDTLQRFEGCANTWCSHSYQVAWGDIGDLYGGPWGFGCVRFRWELMAELPDIVELAGAMDLSAIGVDHHPRHSYQVLDSTVTHWLKGAHARKVCRHRPNVVHHHAYDREGAYAPGVLAPSGDPLQP